MKLIMNNVEYNDIIWNDPYLTFETDMTLSEIESAFTPSGEEVEFSLYEDDIEIARYYNKGIKSMSVIGIDPRTVTVMFETTKIAKNVEDEIWDSLDDSDGAIQELASLVAMFADDDYLNTAESLIQLRQDFDNWRDDLTLQQQNINDLSAMINNLTQRLNNIEIRHTKR